MNDKMAEMTHESVRDHVDRIVASSNDLAKQRVKHKAAESAFAAGCADCVSVTDPDTMHRLRAEHEAERRNLNSSMSELNRALEELAHAAFAH